MSLFSTIAHAGAARLRGFSVKNAGMIAVGLVLGVAIGVTVPSDLSTIDQTATATAAPGGLAHDEFIRINIIDLDALVPRVPVDVVEVKPAFDFNYENTTALDALVPRESGGQGSHTERPSGPR